MLFSDSLRPTGANIKTKVRWCLKRETGRVNCGQFVDSKEFSIKKSHYVKEVLNIIYKKRTVKKLFWNGKIPRSSRLKQFSTNYFSTSLRQ